MRILFACAGLALAASATAMAPFLPRLIAPPLGDPYKESMLPADIDDDGDIDFFLGEGRGGRSYWFEHAGPEWIRHVASDSDLADVGGALIDVDGDGRIDKVSSGFWYRNPGFPQGGSAENAFPAFPACRYSSLEYAHDLYAADIDGDGRSDILAIDYDGIRWYRAPAADSACGPWEAIYLNGPTDPQQHGGIAAGDIDGDGDMDVSRLDRWFENADGKGRTWIEHANIPFPPSPGAGWGLSGRALILDMDGDGHNDIVETDCDAPNGRVAWFGNPDGKGLRWVAHLVKDSTDGQDFHSLIAADFDRDGDIDLFSAGAGSSAGIPKAYVWENLDGHGLGWREHIVYDSVQSIHDAAGADMDGDGDIDILAKDWDGGALYYLENQQMPNPGAGLRRLLRPRTPGGPSSPPGHALYLRKGRLHRADGRSLSLPRPPAGTGT